MSWDTLSSTPSKLNVLSLFYYYCHCRPDPTHPNRPPSRRVPRPPLLSASAKCRAEPAMNRATSPQGATTNESSCPRELPVPIVRGDPLFPRYRLQLGALPAAAGNAPRRAGVNVHYFPNQKSAAKVYSPQLLLVSVSLASAIPPVATVSL